MDYIIKEKQSYSILAQQEYSIYLCFNEEYIDVIGSIKNFEGSLAGGKGLASTSSYFLVSTHPRNVIGFLCRIPVNVE